MKKLLFLLLALTFLLSSSLYASKIPTCVEELGTPSSQTVRGGRSQVQKIPHPEGGHLALKQSLGERFDSDIPREAKVLRQLNEIQSPHFSKFYELRTHSGKTELLSEWIEGETLVELSKRLGLDQSVSLQDALNIFLKSTQSSLEGLQQLHSAGFVHADIKPDNLILRPNGIVALIDLGSASEKTETGYETPTSATGLFSSPEQISAYKSTPANSLFGPKADVYSMGVSLRWLIENFQGYRTLSDVEKRLALKVINEIVRPMTHSRPDQRPSVEEALNLINTL
jgi:serine/threonine protein kinase